MKSLFVRLFLLSVSFVFAYSCAINPPSSQREYYTEVMAEYEKVSNRWFAVANRPTIQNYVLQYGSPTSIDKGGTVESPYITYIWIMPDDYLSTVDFLVVYTDMKGVPKATFENHVTNGVAPLLPDQAIRKEQIEKLEKNLK